MRIEFEYVDENGDEQVQELPAVYAVCGHCEGKGTQDHPAFSNGITSDEWANDWDDESRESYLSGAYDVPCSGCKGLRVEKVVDEARLTPEQKQWLDAYNERADADARERRSEERWGY